MFFTLKISCNWLQSIADLRFCIIIISYCCPNSWQVTEIMCICCKYGRTPMLLGSNGYCSSAAILNKNQHTHTCSLGKRLRVTALMVHVTEHINQLWWPMLHASWPRRPPKFELHEMHCCRCCRFDGKIILVSSDVKICCPWYKCRSNWIFFWNVWFCVGYLCTIQDAYIEPTNMDEERLTRHYFYTVEVFSCDVLKAIDFLLLILQKWFVWLQWNRLFVCIILIE